MPAFYVRVAGEIARRGPGATRRRAGVTFTGDEQLVSTEAAAGAVEVTADQLAAILDDPFLRARESEPVEGAADGEDGGDDSISTTPKPKRSKKAK